MRASSPSASWWVPELVRLDPKNAAFWESNGPVYARSAYELVLDELRETVTAPYVLPNVCRLEFDLLADLTTVLDRSALTNGPIFARLVIESAKALGGGRV
jgi:hypothetical protein